VSLSNVRKVQANNVSVQPVIEAAENAIKEEIETVGKLSTIASSSPYYK
jgi:hypothetical protein